MSTYTLLSDVYIVITDSRQENGNDSDSDSVDDVYDYTNLKDCDEDVVEALRRLVKSNMETIDDGSQSLAMAQWLDSEHPLNGVLTRMWVDIVEEGAKTFCHTTRVLNEEELNHLVAYVDKQLNAWSSAFKDIPFFESGDESSYYAYFDVAKFWEERSKNHRERKRKRS